MTKLAVQSDPCLAACPQPIGIFGGYATHLLLPTIPSIDASSQQETIANLMRGGLDPERWPEAWQFFAAAARGDRERAWELIRLRSLPSGDLSDIDCYNQFALRPTADEYRRLSQIFVGPLLMLLDATAYALGVADRPPVADSMGLTELRPELAAWIWATLASADIESGQFAAAREKLLHGAELAGSTSHVLAAQLRSQAAGIGHYQLALPLTVVKQDYEAAIRLAEGCRLPGFMAELWTQLGMLWQAAAENSRAAMLEAVRAYQTAVHELGDPTSHPRLYAELQNNLGLAYLVLSRAETGDRLRYGIAIQSFRKALEFVTLESDGELWSRISMNLASALQYAPSSHPAENLVQAVEIYEQVLGYRTKARDPVAHALVLLNQANALAHLGIFKPALEKASEAYKLFHWHEQTDAAQTARELVERVNDHLSADQRTSDNQGFAPHGAL